MLEYRYNALSVNRLVHHIPPLAGAAYAIAGAGFGLSAWSGDWIDLLTLALAVMTGQWAGAAARCATSAKLRGPLLAFSLLAPITLVPEVFQPVQELTALRLLTAATVLDSLWVISSTDGRGALNRWLWLLLAYGGSIALAFDPTQLQLFSFAWGLLCLLAVFCVTLVRLLRPADLNQEASALHTLSTLLTASIIGTLLAVMVGDEQELVWAATVAFLAHGLSHVSAQLRHDETSFSVREALAPIITASLLGLNAFIAILNVSQPSPAAAAVAVIIAALLARPMNWLVRELLERIPPRSTVLLEAAIQDILSRADDTHDVDELVASMAPLKEVLSTGGLAVADFDGDQTLWLDDDVVEPHRPGPGDSLRELLATPLRARPLIAAHVVDRSVREAALRPTAAIIEELESDLIIPIPGGTGEPLVGALFVGRPRRGGMLRGRRGALLLELGRLLGPRIKSRSMLETAGRHIATIESEQTAIFDRLELLQYRLERLNEENRLLRADRAGTTPSEVVGRSAAMCSLLANLERAAAVSSSILVRGESGTGRTLVARIIHETGPRREFPLVQFHCASTPQSSHIDVLVGRADGDVARPGLIELADQGTLLLEEVGALSLDAQAELIKLLASSVVSRDQNAAGGPASHQVDVRVVGTMGRVTETALANDTLLPELHDRLKTLEICVPPLRERTGDIPELAQFFVSKASHRHGLKVDGIHNEALERLEQYPWPGNVRQLRAVIEHSSLVAQERDSQSRTGTKRLARGGIKIIRSDLPPLGEHHDQGPPAEAPKKVEGHHILDGTFEEIEREALLRALERAQGNKAEAARLLGFKRTTFNSRLQKYLLDKD